MEAVRNTWTVMKREFKAYFESPIAYVFLAVFLILLGFLTFFDANYYEGRLADLRGAFFRYLPWVFLLLVPAASMRLIAEERRSGTIELLMTLPVTAVQIILGKFLAAWIFLGLALALTFPIIITTYYLGAPDGGVIFCGYLGGFLLAGTYLAVGMLTSAFTRNQVISFVLSVVVCLVLVLAGYPVFTGMFTNWAPTWLVDGVAAFSVMPYFQSMQRGVLDLRDLTYFISVIAVLLFGAKLVTEYKKGD